MNMKVVILCGGVGYRLKEETEFKPKPMVAVGNQPILWHIMKIYSHYGFNEFIVVLGYKGDYIKDYFLNQKYASDNFTLNTKNGSIKILKSNNYKDEFKITFIDTGQETLPGERILMVKDYIPEEDKDFMVTYGDGVSDVNIGDLVKFHKKNGKVVTLTAVPLMSPFGIMELNKDNEVTQFKEKPKLNHWMNGGFYVFSRDIFNYLKSGHDLEKGAFEALAKEKKIAAFRHEGFWKSMNTLKDVIELNEMFERGEMPWIR